MALKSILYMVLWLGGIVLTFRRPFYGALMFAVMTFIRPEVLSYGELKPLRLALVTSLFILSVFLLKFQTFRPLRFERKIIGPMVAFALAAYLSAGVAVLDKSIAFTYATDFLKIIIFCYILAKVIQDFDDLELFFTCVIIGSSFLAVWGFEQHFRGNPRLERVGGGNYNDTNGLATMFTQMLPLYISVALSPGKGPFGYKKLWRVFGIVMSGVALADIVFTQSRGAFLGIAGAAVSFLVLKGKIRYVALIGIAAVAFVIVGRNIPGYMDRISIESMQESKGADRFAIWNASLKSFKDRPILGAGQHNFRYLCIYYIDNPEGFRRVSDPHNIFLLFLADGGILQLGSFLLILWFFYVQSFRAIKVFKKEGMELWANRAIGVQCGMTGLLISDLFHSNAYQENMWWFFLVPAMMLSFHHDLVENEDLLEVGDE